MEKWFESKKDIFFWMFIWEILCMFSNKPSFFASKRVERFTMFGIAMWMIVGYTIRKWGVLTTEDVLMLSGMLLAGGAWNAVQIRKDQKELPNENKSLDPVI